MKHLPLGILITLFALLGHCTPLQAQNSDTTITCPWVENFEDTAALDLWSELTSVGNGQFRLCRLSDSSAWHYVSNDEGNHYLSTSTSGAYLVSPAILMPEDMVEFYLTWNATNNRFTVKVALDSSYSSVENLQWQQIAGSYGAHGIPMSNYQGQRIRLAISSAVSGNVNTIDDISLAYYSEVPVITHFNAPNRVGKEELIDFEYNLGGCSRRDLVATWHSSLKDSTWNTNVSPNGSFHYYFCYDAVGVDTLTFVVSNEFGADTHQVVISVIGDPICNGPYAVPFSENFDSIAGATRLFSAYGFSTYTLNGHLPACWGFGWDGEAYKRPMVINGSYQNSPMSHSSHALVMMAAKKQISEDLSVGGWDSVAYVMLPEFTAPLDTLSLIFFYRYEYNIGTLSVGYMDDDVFVPIADMQYSNYGRVDTVSFHGVPATASRMALRWSCNNAGIFWSVLIDDVRVVETNPLWMRPDVRLSGPFSARIYDTVVFTPQLRRGYTADLTYTWHSSFLDSTWTSGFVSSQSLVYPSACIDTLTLTVTNSYGNSHTAREVVRVLDCDRVNTPFYEEFEEVTAHLWYQDVGHLDDGLPTCWKSTWKGSNLYVPHVISSDGYQYINVLTDKALLMLAGRSSGYDTVAKVTLPRFDQPLQDLSIAFDYCFENANQGTLSVGYVDSNDMFVSVADMTPHVGSYRRDTVSLNSVPDSNANLVLRWWCNESYYGVAIDNLEVFSVSHTPDTLWRTVTVSANVDGICEPYGSGRYLDSSTVEIGYNILDTVAEGGYWRFQGWSDGGTGNPCRLRHHHRLPLRVGSHPGHRGNGRPEMERGSLPEPGEHRRHRPCQPPLHAHTPRPPGPHGHPLHHRQHPIPNPQIPAGPRHLLPPRHHRQQHHDKETSHTITPSRRRQSRRGKEKMGQGTVSCPIAFSMNMTSIKKMVKRINNKNK